ncbi:ABC transporter permease [Microbacterium jiangjiandongii]|uniref:ABC transporter permease n=1 Tax=Microbacterium jiangjiandongii TaxID=3049071 RepID=UPI00214C06D3|nr:ABC transporter permease subunit [Microbacterium sp. zg.Y843]MCR2817009.1 ABC transporter permease subunit [Microbacterium sp. zg.Y843]
MNLFLDALAWIVAPEQWTGSGAIGTAIAVHLLFTVVSVVLAAAVAVPLGWLIGHTGRGRELAVTVSGAARAVPSFGLLILLVLLFGVLNRPEAAVVTFVLLAIPSILAGAYAGVEAIDPAVRDAGRAMGMTGWQVLWRIEAPLGLPLLVAGLRSATLQVVATVTIAAYVNLGGLGQYIIAGIPLRRYEMVLGGALLVIGLALLLDLLFAVLQRVAVPRGLRAGRSARTTTRAPSGRNVAARTPVPS